MTREVLNSSRMTDWLSEEMEILLEMLRQHDNAPLGMKVDHDVYEYEGGISTKHFFTVSMPDGREWSVVMSQKGVQ